MCKPKRMAQGKCGDKAKRGKKKGTVKFAESKRDGLYFFEVQSPREITSSPSCSRPLHEDCGVANMQPCWLYAAGANSSALQLSEITSRPLSLVSSLSGSWYKWCRQWVKRLAVENKPTGDKLWATLDLGARYYYKWHILIASPMVLVGYFQKFGRIEAECWISDMLQCYWFRVAQ